MTWAMGHGSRFQTPKPRDFGHPQPCGCEGISWWTEHWSFVAIVPTWNIHYNTGWNWFSSFVAVGPIQIHRSTDPKHSWVHCAVLSAQTACKAEGPTYRGLYKTSSSVHSAPGSSSKRLPCSRKLWSNSFYCALDILGICGDLWWPVVTLVLVLGLLGLHGVLWRLFSLLAFETYWNWLAKFQSGLFGVRCLNPYLEGIRLGSLHKGHSTGLHRKVEVSNRKLQWLGDLGRPPWRKRTGKVPSSTVISQPH